MKTKIFIKASDPRLKDEYSSMMIESPSDYKSRVEGFHSLGYRTVEIYKLMDISEN